MARLMAALIAALFTFTAKAGEIEQKRHEELVVRAEVERQHAAMEAEDARRRESEKLATNSSERSQSASQTVVTDAMTKKYGPCSMLIPAVFADWNNCTHSHEGKLFQAKTELDSSQRQAENSPSSLARSKQAKPQAPESRRQIGALRASKAAQRSQAPKGILHDRVIHRTPDF